MPLDQEEDQELIHIVREVIKLCKEPLKHVEQPGAHKYLGGKRGILCNLREEAEYFAAEQAFRAFYGIFFAAEAVLQPEVVLVYLVLQHA